MNDIVEHKLSIEEQAIIGARDFDQFLNRIIHDWSKTLTFLVISLVPLFFILDFFIVPRNLLPQVGIYRLIATFIVIIQYVVIRLTKPSQLSYLHGYIVSIVVGGVIVLMTRDLGGFYSSYYAGLNLVIIGVNLLLPWRAKHSAVNSGIIIFLYVVVNFIDISQFRTNLLVNNLFFLCATSVIAVSINYVKHLLIKKEFYLMCELKTARDAIWSEMELAKRIQTALLPDKQRIEGYEIAAAMTPAKEVGGDYYDIIETPKGDKWVTIGDVSGHGVDSGLIMMMAQTSILSKVNNNGSCGPSELLQSINGIIRENISRLGSDHYMTMMAMRLGQSGMIVAGKHQDLLIYRAALNKVEAIAIPGTWLGITEDIKTVSKEVTVEINTGDIVLLFTDGVTEATNADGEMFSQTRLEQALHRYADLPVKKLRDRILKDVMSFQEKQADDITLVVVKK
ncbi:MAG: PP2C family protein-serine/threonine phosphatase [Desulfobacterales bacterium]|jgi:serine phosphatase RsbU (regulator of sigma subunit)